MTTICDRPALEGERGGVIEPHALSLFNYSSMWKHVLNDSISCIASLQDVGSFIATPKESSPPTAGSANRN
jgi:hypothetical protein